MRHDGKTLLVMGATPYSINVIEVAHRLGARTIAVDPVRDHIAKRYADRAYDVDTTDIDALEKICVAEKVDGVFTGYSDVNLLPTRRLCDRMGYPFYAGEEQILKTIDKIRFKEMCRKYDVGVVPQYKEAELETVRYPIIVKPADSYASKGITVCRAFPETHEAIEKARKYSPTGQIIIEKYLGGLDDVNLDYVMQNGKILLSAVGDRFVNTYQKGLSPLTAAVVYPSRHTQEYIDLLDAKVRQMFHDEGLTNGTAFIQSFFDGEQFYFFEMGYRVGGGQSSMMIREMCDLDYVEDLINYALSGEMDSRDLAGVVNPFFKERACCLVPSLTQGVISRIEGLEQIRRMPECKNITQFYCEGDEVPPSTIGNLGQSFLRIHFVADSWARINACIAETNRCLCVISNEGKKMILPGGISKVDFK